MDERERYDTERRAQREVAGRAARAGSRYGQAVGRFLAVVVYRMAGEGS